MDETHLTLNDGRGMPRLGLGVWEIPRTDTARIVAAALDAGYRKIDAAAIYGNEAEVGEGLRRAGLPRNEIFVTTKLWNDAHGFDAALRGFDASAARLKLDAVDLYLIHWPCPKIDHYVETWRALTRLRDEGRARSIGVSNFTPDHLVRIIAETGVVPAIDQIEIHPYLQQTAARTAHSDLGVATESWTPLGRSTAFADPAVAASAARHGKTPAQVILRWHLDLGLSTIPRTTNEARLAENFAVFDFTLSADEMTALAALDRGQRLGPDPMRFP